MSSGVVPQHPPTIEAPADRHVAADAPVRPFAFQDPALRCGVPRRADVRIHEEWFVPSALSSNDGMDPGGEQFTPTAITCSLDAASATASANGVPSLMHAPSRQLNEIHAGASESPRAGSPALRPRRSRGSSRSPGGRVRPRGASRSAAGGTSPGSRRQTVLAAILRTVGQRGPERPHRGRHHRSAPSASAASRASATLRRISDAASSAHAAVGEPGERGLVARRDRDVGPGGEVRFVHPADRPGTFLEEPGRPEGVAQVGAATFEFSGHPAVEDQRSLEAFLHVRRHP